jgi:hypothetical protein
MDPELVNQISQDLINFEIPDVSVIIMGIDKIGDNILPHIYTINDNDIRCDDLIGFSAIGSGARHAESQFMLDRHAWNREVAETLLLTYSAKKASEIAPGVGAESDMFMIGPGLGQLVVIRDEAMTKLKNEYEKLKKKTLRAQNATKAEMKRYVDELGEQAATGQAEQPVEGKKGPANEPSAEAVAE